ncbi:MAG: sigma-70 family RNA polymerase sigma factor [Acidobacteria bacterium]|nr:sigma-70 family RNA polymerase sigma factor [Acidobacteriota bacterium]
MLHIASQGSPAPPSQPAGADAPSTCEIARACATGDRQAFHHLFLRYQHRVYSIALHYTSNPALAMDISQEVFVKLFSAIGSYRGESPFENWLFRIVANCCHDVHRRLRPTIPLEQLPAGADTAPSDPHTSDTARAVREQVARLPEELRMTVVLRYTEGLSYDEIATILACPPGTVASRLNRAHRELAKHLAYLQGRELA